MDHGRSRIITIQHDDQLAGQVNQIKMSSRLSLSYRVSNVNPRCITLKTDK